MKKKIFAFLLTIAMITGLMPSSVMATEDASSNPYSGVYMVLTGMPTLVLEYTPEEGDSIDTFTTVFDVNDETTVPAVEDEGRYAFEIAVSPARLYSPIVAKLYNGEAEVGEYKFVLADYAQKAREIDPACSDLLNSLIAYSNYAAAYAGVEGTDNIQAAEKITALTDAYQSVVIQKEVGEIGASLVLNNACDLYFTFPEAITGYAVKVNNSTVELKENNGALTQSAKPYYYAIEEILPQYWADDYVVEVYEGETLKTQFSYSVLSYVKDNLGAANENLANLLKAMYIYHRDAEMYGRTTAREAAETFENLDAWTLPTNEAATQPTINAAGQLEFAVETGHGTNLVSKAISSNTDRNSSTMVIDLDFSIASNSTTTSIGVKSGSNYVARFLVQPGQLRYINNSGSASVAAQSATHGYSHEAEIMHHGRIVLDMANQKYDFYIDGIKWISGYTVNTYYGSTNGLTLELGIYGSGTGTVCFDNVQVSKMTPSQVDLTTTGLKKTLYSTTFENANNVNGFIWNLNADQGVTVANGKLNLAYTNSASAPTPLLIPTTAGLSGKFVFETDVESSLMTSDRGVWIRLGDNDSQFTVNVRLYANGVKYSTDGNTSYTQIAYKYFSPNDVNRVKLIVDMTAQTYDIYINDQTVLNGIAFATGQDAATITRIRMTIIGAHAASWTAKFDNLKISQVIEEI